VQGLHFHIVRRLQRDGLLFSVELDLRVALAEIVAGRYFAFGIVDGVVHFLQIHFVYYVNGWHGISFIV